MGMDVNGRSGNYFRANVWSWRPIHQLCAELNERHNLGLDLAGWGFNNGAGLRNQKDCDKLADAIEAEVTKPDAPKEYSVNCGMWVNANGTFADGPGTGTRSAHHTDLEHILEFVKFLRECGGSFEID